MTDTTPFSARQQSLRTAVRDIERHVAAQGWDGPVSVYALVRTAAAIEREPGLARELPAEAVLVAQQDAEHLTSIEQEGLPEAETLEELLGSLGWPDEVDGAAIVVERIVVPPEAEPGMPEDAEAAVEYLLQHPEREDVRMAVGVLRTGESWCALRTRKNDSDEKVGGSPDAVPGLVEALRATFR